MIEILRVPGGSRLGFVVVTKAFVKEDSSSGVSLLELSSAQATSDTSLEEPPVLTAVT